MDIVTFEIKCRKPSKKLGAKTMLFLCAFPRKLLNVFKHSHTKPVFFFFFFDNIRKESCSLLHLSIEIHPGCFVYLVIDSFLSQPVYGIGAREAR